MRLNKYLALCGVDSRRSCDKLIQLGKISVNGKVVTELGTTIDEFNDVVYANGHRVEMPNRFVYIMLHKPKGYITTLSDEHDRKTVMLLIPNNVRVVPVGRLDYDSEGLLLFTNDGALTNLLTHPSNRIPKKYVCRISGKITPSDVKAIERGVVIDGKSTAEAKAVIREQDDHKSRVELTIFEGRNREIRKIFETLGYEVEFLKRVAVGELKLGNLARGKYRYLTQKEVDYLHSLGKESNL